MSLLIMPKAKDDESYSGHLLRLANANGFNGIVEMSRAVAPLPEHRTLLRLAEMSRDSLAACLGVDLSTLVARPMIGVVKGTRSHETKNYVDFGWPNNAAWCPLCIKESPYWRGSWDLPLAAACARHCLRLQRKCPRCSKRASCARRWLLHCACGHPFADAPAEAPSPEEMSFQRRLDASAGGGSVFLAQVKAMSLADQVLAISSTLNILLGLRISRGRHRADYIAQAARSSTGRAFLKHPDAAIETAVLDLARQRLLSSRRAKLCLERMPDFVIKQIDSVRELTRTRFKNVAGFENGTSTDLIRQRGYATVNDLHYQFGWHRVSCKQWCEAGLLPGVRRRKLFGSWWWTVPAEIVDELTIMFRSTLSCAEAAGRLRLAPFQVYALERLSVLPSCLENGGRYLRRYRPGDVDNVLDLLEALAEPLAPNDSRTREMEPLPYVYQVDRRSKVARRWMDRFHRVLSGTDPLFQTGSTDIRGIGAFLAPPSERLHEYVTPV